jgi:hypothetical protein
MSTGVWHWQIVEKTKQIIEAAKRDSVCRPYRVTEKHNFIVIARLARRVMSGIPTSRP